MASTVIVESAQGLDGPSVRTAHVTLDDAMEEDSDQQTGRLDKPKE